MNEGDLIKQRRKQTMTSTGAHECHHLNLGRHGKAKTWRTKVKTGFGKTDRPGLQGGSGKRDIWEGQRGYSDGKEYKKAPTEEFCSLARCHC
jgi:hypothetical protein